MLRRKESVVGRWEISERIHTCSETCEREVMLRPNLLQLGERRCFSIITYCFYARATPRDRREFFRQAKYGRKRSSNWRRRDCQRTARRAKAGMNSPGQDVGDELCVHGLRQRGGRGLSSPARQPMTATGALPIPRRGAAREEIERAFRDAFVTT
jgi:hypothetical protein